MLGLLQLGQRNLVVARVKGQDRSDGGVGLLGRHHDLGRGEGIGLEIVVGRVDVGQIGFVVLVEVGVRMTVEMVVSAAFVVAVVVEVEGAVDFVELGWFVFDPRVHSGHSVQHTIVYQFP